MTETNPVLETLKEIVHDAGSQKKVAEDLGISAPYLHDILEGKRDVSDNIARKLGFLRAPTQWVLIEPDAGLLVSADGKIHGDQIGEALARLDARTQG
jgi:hypothetical protein